MGTPSSSGAVKEVITFEFKKAVKVLPLARATERGIFRLPHLLI